MAFAFSAQANRLYDLYNAHVNRDRGDLVVWPTLDDLASMMGLSRGDKVAPYMRELETGGAVDVETLTKTGGNGRRYVITLRVHPPEGFTGPLQSSDWHHANRDGQLARTTMAGRARGVHPDEPAEQEVPPLEGGDVGPLLGGDVHPPEGVVTKNKLNQNKEEQPAPSARSAADARRASAGSGVREEDSGSAATDKTGPVEAEEEPGDSVAARPVPGPRKPKSASDKGTGPGSPFPLDVRQRIYATEALLPPELRTVLAAQFPYGHLPNVSRQVIARALGDRTPDQLGVRAARRWTAYGYERDHHDGVLRSPLGVVEELLRPTPYCPDTECEDGLNIHTGHACKPCEARIKERRTDRLAGRWVPEHRPPRLYRDREQCEVCDQPFPGVVPDDRVCQECHAGLDRAAAHVNGTPAGEAPVETDPGNCAAPPSSAYRRCREQQAQTRLDALQSPAAPF
ncbi:hypothetical protein [Streptomyces inusitatus]|uniref:hypothetical protein n=1 Tax=Streptomyces inusitatus TaxID=68221 RepID=UPI00167DCCA8|nr:hypothetical protein [Streptomyces inusitatus]